MSIELPPLPGTALIFPNGKPERVMDADMVERAVEARERILQARIAELERLWRLAEDRYALADAAAISHAKRIADLEHARRCHGEARVALNEVTKTAQQNAELLTGYWMAAVAEVKALRRQMREAGITPDGADELFEEGNE